VTDWNSAISLTQIAGTQIMLLYLIHKGAGVIHHWLKLQREMLLLEQHRQGYVPPIPLIDTVKDHKPGDGVTSLKSLASRFHEAHTEA
jgi:hypothetical protein